MRRQRGFGTGELLIWAVVIAGAVAGLAAVYVGIDGRGYERGKHEVEAQYAQRDADQERKVAIRIHELEEQNRALEAKNAADIAAIDHKLQGDIARETEQKNRALDQLRSGVLVLRDPGATVTTCGGGSGGTETGAGTRDGNGPTGAVISAAAGQFLLELTAEADAVVDQLSAAQAVIVADRMTCR